MTIDLKSIFNPNLIHPLNCDDFKKGLLGVAPLFILSFFYLPALLIVIALLAIISSRRLADLLGLEFYANTRAAGAWLLMAGLFSIPFVGVPFVLWILCTWDRYRVREFLRDFFEVAEMI